MASKCAGLLLLLWLRVAETLTQTRDEHVVDIAFEEVEQAPVLAPLLSMQKRGTMTKTQRYASVMKDMLGKSSSRCDLCGGPQDWIFILATGRSGSTTALEMINAVPKFYMAGENYGVMNSLMDLYNARAPALADSETHVLCALQTFARTIIGDFDSGVKAIGFKEIRHVTADQLTFLRKVFPCAKFIVNTRKNLDKQHKSQFQQYIEMGNLKNWTAQLEQFTEETQPYAYKLKLEDYSVKLFNGMLEFLGVSGCKFTEIVHANNAWHWNDDTNKSKQALKGECIYHSWDKDEDGRRTPDKVLQAIQLHKKMRKLALKRPAD